MNVRKAQKADIDSIEKIYDRIHDSEEQGLSTIGWIRGVYPTRKTAEAALERGDLFVMDDGNVVAAAVINQTQVYEYKDAAWKHAAEDREVMVLHCLVVDPLKGGKDMATLSSHTMRITQNSTAAPLCAWTPT